MFNRLVRVHVTWIWTKCFAKRSKVRSHVYWEEIWSHTHSTCKNTLYRFCWCFGRMIEYNVTWHITWRKKDNGLLISKTWNYLNTYECCFEMFLFLALIDTILFWFVLALSFRCAVHCGNGHYRHSRIIRSAFSRIYRGRMSFSPMASTNHLSCHSCNEAIWDILIKTG